MFFISIYKIDGKNLECKPTFYTIEMNDYKIGNKKTIIRYLIS